jgi:hypothetical protein
MSNNGNRCGTWHRDQRSSRLFSWSLFVRWREHLNGLDEQTWEKVCFFSCR